jgi:hypothetical protein
MTGNTKHFYFQVHTQSDFLNLMVSRVKDSISVERIATYALSREKRDKTITKNWDLSKGRLIKSTFNALNDFVATNVAYILSLPEISPSDRVSEKKSPFNLRLAGRVPTKPAVVVDFKREGERSATMRRLVDANDAGFFELSEKLASWFRDSLFWPKTYLFVTQATIRRGRTSWRIAGILATKLEYGEFAEDAEKIVEQMQKGVIRKKIRKGIVYPHYVEKDGGLVREAEVKVFESQSRPANYFYHFLRLESPVLAQQFAVSKYDEVAKTVRSVDQFVSALRRENASIPEQVYVTIELDETSIKCPLSALGNTAKLSQVGSKYAALIFGAKCRALLGNHDLVSERKLPLIPEGELARDLQAKQIVRK